MSHDDQVGKLLEEALESDRSVEEVCAQCPELLEEVRQRLKRVRSVEAQFDSLFPISSLRSLADRPLFVASDDPLPSIPGFEIQAVLGRGGMGVVYKARHLKLNRVLALKMLLAGSHAGRQAQLRFLREAESVAKLQHSNIVQIFDFGETDGQPFYTMEFVDGGSLAEKLGGECQPARESAQLIAILARAVSTAHACGIVHRDLKPANILLGEDGSPKISDFGLARRLDGDEGLTQTGARLGTPNYMAPEQMVGNSAAMGPSVDLFSLGAILYEMLTGHAPFSGKSMSETERRLMTEEPAPPSRLNTKTPCDLETICLKCLEKAPQNRYATCEELAADLERFLRYEPIHARPITPAERGLRWVRRNPLLAALTVTGAVVVGLLVGDAIRERTLASGRRTEKSRLTARLESGVQLVRNGQFEEAFALLGELGDGGNEDLRQRIDRTLAELKVVQHLDVISAKRTFATIGYDGTRELNDEANRDYDRVFKSAGIGAIGEDPAGVAKRIRDSAIQDALVDALDDWSICETSDRRREWLLDVARRADSQSSAWDDRARDPVFWNDRDALAELAGSAFDEKRPVPLLRALGDRLSASGLDSIPFRRQVQRENPDSFLANFSLADSLREKEPMESIRFYQAAVATRPRAVPANNNLAVALSAAGRNDEALSQFQQALKLDQRSSGLHYNLGTAWLAASNPNEAIREFQQSTELSPGFALAHISLGKIFIQERRFDEAGMVLRRGLDLLSPDDAMRPTIETILKR